MFACNSLCLERSDRNDPVSSNDGTLHVFFPCVLGNAVLMSVSDAAELRWSRVL